MGLVRSWDITWTVQQEREPKVATPGKPQICYKVFQDYPTLQRLSILDVENYGFILNTCHDTAKRAETRVGFPVIFSRLR